MWRDSNPRPLSPSAAVLGFTRRSTRAGGISAGSRAGLMRASAAFLTWRFERPSLRAGSRLRIELRYGCRTGRWEFSVQLLRPSPTARLSMAPLWCRVMERRTIRHDRFCKSGASKPFSCGLQCGSLIRPSIHGHAIEVPPRMSDASHRLDVRGECLVVTALLHEISTTRFLFICSVASYQR